MKIKDVAGSNGKSKYEVTIEERRLEDLKRANKIERRDERAFEVVAEMSAFNEKAYSLFARPIVRSIVSEQAAELSRSFHPLRFQRWAFSDLNPWLWPLPATAAAIKQHRCTAPPENPYRRLEKAASNMIIAGFDLFRDVRDAMLELLFFQIYGPSAIFGAVEQTQAVAAAEVADPRELPIVKDALTAIGTGGYPEAIALIGALVGRGAGRIPSARLELVDRLVRSDDRLSKLSKDDLRRIKAEQAVVAELEPERGLKSLPTLLANAKDRRRALQVLDEAVAAVEPSPEQETIVERIRDVLSADVARKRRGTDRRPESKLAMTHPK
jgi:hypothetical protein